MKLITLGALIVAASPAAALPAYEVSLLGEFALPSTTTFGGTLIGGLSSLDYVPGTGRYLAISDDRGNDRASSGSARFYEFDIAVGAGGITGVTPTAVTILGQPGGGAYPDQRIDPEGLRRAPDGTIFYASEGIRQPVFGTETRIDPFVRRANADGSFIGEAATPGYFSPGPVENTTTGVRTNFGFESLAISPDGAVVSTVNENALIQDGPAATFGVDGVTRLTQFDSGTGALVAQYVYLADPPAEPSNPVDATAFTGIVEMLDLGGGEYLVLERTFAIGGAQSSTGDHFIEIYLASTAGATDVSGLTSLEGAVYAAMTKTLFADLNTLVPFLTNVEGLTFGPDLANGDRTLLLVGDNNFGGTVPSQFIALRLAAIETPAPATLALFGLGLVGLAGRRARR